MTPFKLLEKSTKGFDLPQKTIKIGTKSISFSKDLRKLFEDKYGLEIYVDKKENKLGFIPSKDVFKAYKLNRYKQLPEVKPLYRLFPDIIKGVFEAKIEDNMVVIDLEQKKKEDYY